MSNIDTDDLQNRLGICVFPWIPGISMTNYAAVH